jgi:hypothetical protein
MRVLRAVLTLLIALSMVSMPVVAGTAQAIAAQESMAGAHPDCCPPGKHCNKDMPSDCQKMAACTLKCFSVLAAIPARSVGAQFFVVRTSQPVATQRACSRTEVPPAPPPRV